MVAFGDLNAMVRETTNDGVTGACRVHRVNEIGEHVFDANQEKGLLIWNELFK